MKYLNKVLDVIVDIIAKLCCVLLLMMTGATFAQAIYRYVFQGAFYWAEPTAILCMIYITFMASVVAVHWGAHTRVDYFVNLLPPFLRKIVDSFVNLVCAAFCIILSVNAMPIIETTCHTALNGLRFLNRSFYYWSILIGCALMSLFFVVRTVNLWMGENADLTGTGGESK